MEEIMQKGFSAFFALMALSFMSSHQAKAGEDGLYPAAPPADSAFVRFLNAGSATPTPVKIRGKSYGAVNLGSISSYAPVAAGAAALSFGVKSSSVELKPGIHYAVLLMKDNMVVLDEPSDTSKLKAQIILINASRTPHVSLKTADGAAEIVNPVAPGALGGRAVNAVNAPFSVYAEKEKIEDIAPQPLKRGARYAIVVYDDANGKPAATFN
jgi:alginate O-acetyltransferase complex protein AlgF